MVRVKHSLIAFAVLALVSTSTFVRGQIRSGGTKLAGFIRGQIRYEDGRLADHVVVRLRSDAVSFQTEMTTDPQGKFDFEGLGPSTYRLTVEGQGFRPYESVLDISVSNMAYEQITLKFAKDRNSEAVPPEGSGGSLSADSIPPAARKEYDEGQKALNDKKDAEAGIKHFRKAIQLYSKYSEAYLALGLLYMDLGKFDDAQPALQVANEITPTAPGGYFALGTMYNAQKKYEDAEKALTHGLELKSDVPDGQYELAKTYWATGKWQDAEPHAQKAVALDPAKAPPHVLLGNIALRKQDPLGAVKEFQEYLRLDPKGPMAPGVSQMIQKIEASQKK
jgi:cytochrome c-type biogenesis protein CcmH/NrfG